MAMSSKLRLSVWTTALTSDSGLVELELEVHLFKPGPSDVKKIWSSDQLLS